VKYMNLDNDPVNTISSEDDISRLIYSDPWRMNVLAAAEKLNLPDWWIGAGFLRNLVWDAIEGVDPQVTRDVDLVYFDSENTAAEIDWTYDEQLKASHPFAEWEVRNQARMHYKNNFAPYKSTADGISNWVETATCVAVKLEAGVLRYIFCYGTDDLFGLIARPIAQFQSPTLISEFHKRVNEKRWQERWPRLKIEVT